MLKTLLSVLSLGSTLVTAQPFDVDPARVYPYLVPSEYLQYHGDAPHWPLGHDIHIVLVLDMKGAVRNIVNKDLKTLHLNPDEARELAISNLDKLLASGAIGMRKFTGPQGKPFILMGGHWATASSILVPVLLQSATRQLRTDQICISIPNRDAILMFPMGDKAYRDEMLGVIHKNETDNRKMLTFGFFEYSNAGIRALE